MLEAKNLGKVYGDNVLVEDFNLTINKGDFLAITGESGRGKTTILNMLGFLENATSGEVWLEGKPLTKRPVIMMAQRYKFGYLFQNYALVENYTVKDNLRIALKYRKVKNEKEAMIEALSFVNLDASTLEKKIYQLSGGEQQRVAMARVILKDAEYVFADEPTGNLDEKNRDLVFDMLKKLNELGKTIIFVTHDTELAQRAKTWLKL